MSILVGRIANKFWNNSDNRFPNSFPVYEEEEFLPDDEPHMNEFFSGTIYLYGDKWNHCRFKDAYYSLYIYQVIDEDKKYYLYRLERDLWFDVLSARPKVVGDLSNSNNDELLAKNLVRTIPIIDNPARPITINFADVEFDWRKSFTFEESKAELPQIVLSKYSLDNFIDVAKSKFVKEWKKIDEAFYSGCKNPAVFIAAYLEPSVLLHGWKDLLRNKVNEFVRGIAGEAGKELKIGKVTQGKANKSGSKLIGNYCITQKVEGIAQGEENLKLKRIDLSGLSDIIPVNFHDLKEIEPYTRLDSGEKSGIFDVVDTKPHAPKFLAKIRRLNRIPVGQKGFKYPRITFPYVKDRWSDLNSPDDATVVGEQPQRIRLKYLGKEKRGILWWTDNLNYLIGFRDSRITSWISKIEGYVGTYGGFIPLSSRFKFKEYFDNNWKNLLGQEFPLPWAGFIEWWASKDNEVFQTFPNIKNSLVSFGFLIYGIERRLRDWKLFEYVSKTSLKRVPYFSGISSNFLEEYRKEGEWWSVISDKLKNLQPSQEFVKFYLDNFYFSWAYFIPFGGSHDDNWGISKHVKGEVYRDRIPSRDISDINGKWAKLNPFNDQRYPEHRNNVDNKLNRLLLRSSVELPDGMTLEAGDYFFNSLEYQIEEWNIADRNKEGIFKVLEDAKEWSGGLSGMQAVIWVEDLNTTARIGNFATEGKKLAVLCSNLSGGFEIRTLETFNRRLALSDAPNQIVTAVNGAQGQNLEFTLIKKLHEPIYTDTKKDFTDEDIAKAIEAFYRVQGYKTRYEGGLAFWNSFNEQDFSEADDVHRLFDLVGTEWYCFITKGKISLIAKNKDLFEEQKGKTMSLLHSENKDLNLSLLEKINQKVRFQFLNYPYYLNWKTSFSDDDRISLVYETLKPTEFQTQFEQWFIKLETGFDTIFYENISVPKKMSEAINLADSVALQKLQRDFVKDQVEYKIDSDKLLLAEQRYRESIRRAENELHIRKIEAFATLGTSVASSTLGIGMIMRKGTQTVQSKTRTMETAGGVYIKGDNKKAVVKPGTPMTVTEHFQTKKPPKWPSLMAGYVMGLGSKAVSQSMSHAFRFPELQRQIDVDKQLGASELAIESTVINTAHLDRQIEQQNKLSAISNSYNNPMINEREVLGMYMDKDEWHGGKKLKPAYLFVCVPSEEQLKQLRSFKEEFGIICDIPDVQMSFYNEMEPDVIRFRNLDDAHITGIDNLAVREFLKVHLLAGIKIVKTSEKTHKLLTPQEYKEEIFRIGTDLHTHKTDLAEKDKQITELTNRVNEIGAQVREECNREKTDLNNRINQIQEQLNNVNSDLAKKTEELEKLKAECEADKKKLADEIQSHKEDKEDLTQQLNNERREVLNKRDEVNRLIKEKENLENQKADIERQLREALAAKNAIAKQLEDEKKKPRPAAPTTPQRPIDDCAFIKDLVSDPYEIDIKERENGLSRFIDLIAAICESLKWLRRSGLDARLLSNQSISPIIKLLEAMEEEIPMVDKMEDAIRDKKWDKFARKINDPKLHENTNEDISRIYGMMREIIDMQTSHTIHGVKAALDELNYLVNKAKRDLGDQVDKNEDIRDFFLHAYPGKTIDIYKELFGKPEMAVARKRFSKEVQCVTGQEGTSSLDTLQNFRDSAIRTFKKPVLPDPPPPPPIHPVDLPKAPEKPKEVTLSGIPLTTDRKYFIPPFNWFRNEVTVTHASTLASGNPVNFADIGKTDGAFKVGNTSQGIPRWGLQMWNLPYSITDSKDSKIKNSRAVWVTAYGRQGQKASNIYFVPTVTFVSPAPGRLSADIRQLWKDRRHMNIDPSVMELIKSPNPTKSIFVETSGLQHQGVYQFARMAIFGKDGALKGWEPYAEDIIKLLFILNRNRFSIYKWRSGKEASHSYYVYELTTYSNAILPVYSNLKFGTGAAEYFNVGMLSPMQYVDDLQQGINSKIGTNALYNRIGPIYRIMSWILAVVKNPDDDSLFDLLYPRPVSELQRFMVGVSFIRT